MNAPDARLERLLGGAALLPLRQRLRRHFERHGDSDPRQMLHLTRITAAKHEALALLTGHPPRSAHSMRIDVVRIDTALRAAGICDSLRAALEQLDGPLANRAAAHAAAQAWSALSRRPDRDARLHAWLQTPGAGALLKRLARRDAAAAEDLLQHAHAVLRCLPAVGLARAQLAARTLGNAHALDAGRPVASIVLAAWRHGETATSASDAPREEVDQELEDTGDPDEAGPLIKERIRDIWARAGVLVNELARPALMLNLPVASATQATWMAGEPAYLSLRQLLRAPPVWSVIGLPVFICENPNLLAIAADRLGARCMPLVCTDGMPAAAQRMLLTQLSHAGAQLHYHGDFDWPGVQIANHVMRQFHAQPWRMTASDYETAVMGAQHMQRDLATTTITAPWDPLLVPAMHRHGLAIAEEAVAEGLLDDLRA